MFTSKDSAGQSIGLIPDKTSSKAVINVRGIKNSQNTGSRYIDCEFTLVDGEFNGRKVWSIVMDPSFEGNSEEARKLGKKFLVRMLEAAGLVTVGNEESYGRFPTIQDVINALNGQTIAIKVGIKKGTDGHADKNSVSDYYSPNPESGYADKFKQVMSGSPGSSSQTPSFGGKPGFLTSPKNGNPF